MKRAMWVHDTKKIANEKKNQQVYVLEVISYEWIIFTTATTTMDHHVPKRQILAQWSRTTLKWNTISRDQSAAGI